MKQVWLLVGLVFFSIDYSFGQAAQWGNWEKNACYNGIAYRAKRSPQIHQGKYEWWVQFKNTYSQSVEFSAYLDGSQQGNLFTLKPGSDQSTWTFSANTASIHVAINKVCFYFKNGQAWCHEKEINGYASYANCAGNYTIYNKNKNTTPSAASNNTTYNSEIGHTNNSSTNNSNNSQQSSATQPTGNTYMDVYKQAMHAHENKNYEEAINLWNKAYGVAVNDAQRKQAKDWAEQSYRSKQLANQQQNNQQIATQNAEQQRQNKLLEQQRQQQLQQGITDLTNSTAELIKVLSNRKRAIKSILSDQDAAALLAIVNAENPKNYANHIIDIFSDLGYTHKSTDQKNDFLFINMYDNSTIQWPLSIFIYPANNSNNYASISFSYQRKEKLKNQLSVLGNKLQIGFGGDYMIKGISASRQVMENEKQQTELSQKTQYALSTIETFERLNYWNSTKREVFDYAKRIAEAYEDENSLHDIDEAIRYYRKAASISLDELASPWKGDKKMRAYQQKELAKVYFNLAYLLDNDTKNNGQEAIDWYIKSYDAEYGLVTSNLNIARIYKEGLQGVEKDWKLASKYYKLAAEEKSAKAMYQLGVLYETGGPNLERSASESKKWMKKACKADKKYCD